MENASFYTAAAGRRGLVAAVAVGRRLRRLERAVRRGGLLRLCLE